MAIFNDLRIYPQEPAKGGPRAEAVNVEPYRHLYWAQRFTHQLYQKKFKIDGWPIVYIYLNPDYAHGTVTPLKPGRCQEFYCGINIDKYNELDSKGRDDLFIEALYRTLCFTLDSGLTNDRDAIDMAYRVVNTLRENATYIRLAKKRKSLFGRCFLHYR